MPVKELCACHEPLITQQVRTDAGMVKLTLCLECDRPKCGACGRTSGPFFASKNSKCTFCGNSMW